MGAAPVERLDPPAPPVSASAEFPATPPFDPTEDGTAMTELPPTPETSDVHTVPLAGGKALEDDEALDFPPAPMAGAADAFADFEDELEAENTRIDDSHLLAEQSTALLEDLPEQPFLPVEKGNDHGREFVLQEGLNGIGRGIDNDVILADVSVSRRH
ncbi:MAG: FHA domain-containing protein, partial [Sandaracinaceae bacterium]